MFDTKCRMLQQISHRLTENISHTIERENKQKEITEKITDSNSKSKFTGAFFLNLIYIIPQ